MDFPLFPERASTLAGRVDGVFYYELGICVFFTILICVLILYYATKYRRGSTADRSNPATTNLALEVLWIAVPLALSMVIFVWATIVYLQLYRAPENAPEVYVLGRQWMWEVRHPGGKR